MQPPTQILMPACQPNNHMFFPVVQPPPLTQQQPNLAIMTAVNPQNPMPTPVPQHLNNSIIYATAPPPSKPIWYNEE
jgi:hypothetical protein